MREMSSYTYRYDLDLLKGIAIIAVVLYHAGWCKSGYLGVDMFFVVNGYLVVPKVIDEIASEHFQYFRFLEKKLFRLLPLVLVVSVIALTIGCIDMLPHDFRFLSEEILASSLFGNNILQAITTQNYWAAIYHKLMMHTWFLGVLFQFYIVFPLLMLVFRKWMKSTIVVLSVLSLLLYLSPIDTVGDKYYLLPYRFFELTIGGLVAMKSIKRSSSLSYFSLLGILLIAFFGAFTIEGRTMPYNLVSGTNTIHESFLPRELILILTVLFASILIISNKRESRLSSFAINSKFIAPMGRMSLSIFLWHQPLFAFYRYFYTDTISFQMMIGIISITLFLSIFTYNMIEKKVYPSYNSRCYLLLSFISINAIALWVYSIGGTVRDIPELDIRKGDSPKVFECYTDRVYEYDKEFSLNSTKKRVLVIGNSFARDFANILLESPLVDSIQLSYRYSFDDCPITRIQQCDRIYYFGWKHNVPQSVWLKLKSSAEIWGIGTKNHGSSNGIFYKNRHHKDYYNQKANVNPDFFTLNSLLHEEWKDKYVDLLNLMLLPDGTIPVFSPNKHFISYDGKHLTQSGAVFYAHLIWNHVHKKEYLCRKKTVVCFGSLLEKL